MLTPSLEKTIEQLERSQTWSAAQHHEHQGRHLHRLVAFAREMVPWYRESLRRLAPLPSQDYSDSTWQAWLQCVPILHRSDVQKNGKALLPTALPTDWEPTGWVESSGSTGEVVRVQKCRLNQTLYRAFAHRRLAWHRMHACSKVVGIVDARRPSSLALSIGTPIDQQVAWLVAHKPDGLITYPSNLAALLERWPREVRLKVVGTTAERVTPTLRHRCLTGTGAALHDLYSCEEIGHLAIQCPHDVHYHVQAEHVVMEVLDDHDRPCEVGQEGRVVVTGLASFAMPLLRYELGDVAVLGRPCPHYPGLPTLQEIRGRTRNMVVYPNGSRRWPLNLSQIADVAPVEKFRFEQRSKQRIDLFLRGQFSEKDRSCIVDKCRELLGREFDFQLRPLQDDEKIGGRRRKHDEFISFVDENP